MTLIIGLCGPQGAGKSTVADYLVKTYGAKRYSFAQPLKEIAKRTLDFSDEQVYGTQAQKDAKDPRYGFSPRWFLQRLGTEGIRSVFGSGFWAETTLGIIRKERPPIAVIDDLRFLNELAQIVVANGKAIRVTCPDKPVAESTHESELGWQRMDVDYSLSIPFGKIHEVCQQFFSQLLGSVVYAQA
jgi:hypothetical protein